MAQPNEDCRRKILLLIVDYNTRGRGICYQDICHPGAIKYIAAPLKDVVPDIADDLAEVCGKILILSPLTLLAVTAYVFSFIESLIDAARLRLENPA